MTLASFIHDAIFGCPLTTEERPECDGQAAWVAMQAHFRDREERAKKSHGKVNDVRARRMSLVHSALARSMPTEGLSGAAADRVTP